MASQLHFYTQAPLAISTTLRVIDESSYLPNVKNYVKLWVCILRCLLSRNCIYDP